MKKISKDILKLVYKERPLNSHKYDFGLLIVIGGGKFYTGSPILAALAGFRAGVDMVHIFAPKRVADIAAAFSPNLAAYPLIGDILRKKHLPILLDKIMRAIEVSNGKVAIVIGGGMGRGLETQNLVLELLKAINLPLVIDADAIHFVAKKPEILKGKKIILTPHLQEFFVLTGKKIIDLEIEERAKIVKEMAKKFETIILLKGKYDIISDGNEIYINETGSPYMTKGGTGDTLAGICASLLAQGVEPILAAQISAYINGKAGEIAANLKGPSLLATDLIEAIPEVIKNN